MFHQTQMGRWHYSTFLVSLVAVFGSLFFSEVMKLPPCELCWYQRICMYPIPLLMGVGILLKDVRSTFYAIPLLLIGLSISIYHNLLYYGLIENIVPCSQGVSCTSRQIEWFGFVTIPFLSLLSFLTCLILLSFVFKFKKD